LRPWTACSRAIREVHAFGAKRRRRSCVSDMPAACWNKSLECTKYYFIHALSVTVAIIPDVL
jgi:hypothetical protein